jgi:3-methyladenine DNA glycosylase/8-oxoguanine DNA glycosylase
MPPTKRSKSAAGLDHKPSPDALPALIAKLKNNAALTAAAAHAAACRERPGTCPFDGDAAVRELVRSILVRSAPLADAEAALNRLGEAMVDGNEIRVGLVEELAAAIGPRFPGAVEKAREIKSALNDVYRREHCVRLAHLAERPKREAAAYISGLKGLGRFAADRTLLLTLGGHAVPCDETLAARLIATGAALAGSTPDDCADRLTRCIRAGEAEEAYRVLEAWARTGAPNARAGRAAAPAHPRPGPRRKKPAPAGKERPDRGRP